MDGRVPGPRRRLRFVGNPVDGPRAQEPAVQDTANRDYSRPLRILGGRSFGSRSRWRLGTHRGQLALATGYGGERNCLSESLSTGKLLVAPRHFGVVGEHCGWAQRPYCFRSTDSLATATHTAGDVDDHEPLR